jgi:ABC-2 type transport system ATP-binding protein
METRYAIDTEALSRSFGELRAVDGLNLAVPRGSIFAFLGENGAGKTTTVRLLLGLLRPTAGRASVLGCDLASEAVAIRTRSGALLEHDGLYERMRVEDNLDLIGRACLMGRGERRARTKELLTRFGLWERRKEPSGALSRGKKQQLAIGRAIFHRPELVFLDEPSAGLDPVAAAAVRKDIAALAANEGTTVFLNTHNLAEAEALASLVGVIRKGRLLALGSPAELRRGSGSLEEAFFALVGEEG